MAETLPTDNDPSHDPKAPAEPKIAGDRLPEPDQAWKTLILVNDWIKHAGAKVASTLAGSGVAATVLFNLVNNQIDPDWVLSILTVMCAVPVVAAGGSAAIVTPPLSPPSLTTTGLQLIRDLEQVCAPWHQINKGLMQWGVTADLAR